MLNLIFEEPLNAVRTNEGDGTLTRHIGLDRLSLAAPQQAPCWTIKNPIFGEAMISKMARWGPIPYVLLKSKCLASPA